MDDFPDVETFSFEFELHSTDDGKIITLVCTTDRELTPDEYAQALQEFAERIDSIVNMNEVVSDLLN